jgi:DNA-binding transcriptional MocR family regulator
MTKQQDVRDDLRKRLRAGEFPIGGDFISMSTVVKQYDVGDGTAYRAIKDIEAEGHIAMRPGRAPVVVSIPSEDDGAARISKLLTEHGLSINDFLPFVEDHPSVTTLIRASLGLPRATTKAELAAGPSALAQAVQASDLATAATLVGRLDGRELADDEAAVLVAAKVWLARLLRESDGT